MTNMIVLLLWTLFTTPVLTQYPLIFGGYNGGTQIETIALDSLTQTKLLLGGNSMDTTLVPYVADSIPFVTLYDTAAGTITWSNYFTENLASITILGVGSVAISPSNAYIGIFFRVALASSQQVLAVLNFVPSVIKFIYKQGPCSITAFNTIVLPNSLQISDTYHLVYATIYYIGTTTTNSFTIQAMEAPTLGLASFRYTNYYFYPGSPPSLTAFYYGSCRCALLGTYSNSVMNVVVGGDIDGRAVLAFAIYKTASTFQLYIDQWWVYENVVSNNDITDIYILKNFDGLTNNMVVGCLSGTALGVMTFVTKSDTTPFVPLTYAQFQDGTTFSTSGIECRSVYATTSTTFAALAYDPTNFKIYLANLDTGASTVQYTLLETFSCSTAVITDAVFFSSASAYFYVGYTNQTNLNLAKDGDYYTFSQQIGFLMSSYAQTSFYPSVFKGTTAGAQSAAIPLTSISILNLNTLIKYYTPDLSSTGVQMSSGSCTYSGLVIPTSQLTPLAMAGLTSFPTTQRISNLPNTDTQLSYIVSQNIASISIDYCDLPISIPFTNFIYTESDDTLTFSTSSLPSCALLDTVSKQITFPIPACFSLSNYSESTYLTGTLISKGDSLTTSFELNIIYTDKDFSPITQTPITVDRSQIPCDVPITPFSFSPTCPAAIWTYTAAGLPACASFDPVAIQVSFPQACYAAMSAALYTITVTGTLNTGETPQVSTLLLTSTATPITITPPIYTPLTYAISQLPIVIPLTAFSYSPTSSWNTFTYYQSGMPTCGSFQNIPFPQIILPLTCKNTLTISTIPITITGTLTTGESDTSLFVLNFIAKQTPPYFVITPNNIGIPINATQNYTLPNAIDDEGDSFTLTIGALPSFMNYSDGVFQVSPIDKDVGITTFNVTLKDSSGAKQVYIIYVQVFQLTSKSNSTSNTSNSTQPSSSDYNIVVNESIGNDSKSQYIQSLILTPSSSIDIGLQGKLIQVTQSGQAVIQFGEQIKDIQNLEAINSTVLNIQVIPRPYQDPEAVQIKNWTCMRQNGQILYFQVKYVYPLNISTTSEGMNFLQMTILDGSYFSTFEGRQIADNYTMSKKIPKYPKDVQRGLSSTSQIIPLIVQIGILANFGMNLLLQAFLFIFRNQSMNMIWSFVNCIQLILYVPLFTIQFPSNAFMFFYYLISVAQFNLIPMESVVDAIFQFTHDEEYSDEFSFTDIFYSPIFSLLNSQTIWKQQYSAKYAK